MVLTGALRDVSFPPLCAACGAPSMAFVAVEKIVTRTSSDSTNVTAEHARCGMLFELPPMRTGNRFPRSTSAVIDLVVKILLAGAGLLFVTKCWRMPACYPFESSV
jgi:hypothetical protein